MARPRAAGDTTSAMSLPILFPRGSLTASETGTRQDADTPLVPRLRRQPVEMDVVWVVEAIASVLLNLPKFDELIAFRGAEQKSRSYFRISSCVATTYPTPCVTPKAALYHLSVAGVKLSSIE